MTVKALDVLPVHPELAAFGSAARPLRPSRVSKLLGCAMGIVLVMHDESEGGAAAQTGNLVHDAAEHYHKTKGTLAQRTEAGLAALEAARAEFPAGDPEKAREIFRAYAQDRENIEAEVLWVEQQVTLTLAADPGDPTGEPIVITGTLDQVRRDKADGVLRVWDIKTGDYKSGDENVLDYLTQQAVYTLAARATLDPTIDIGGLIYTPAYFKARSKVHLPNTMTVEQAEDLLLTVPAVVSMIRRGLPIFRPEVDHCKFCDVKRNLGKPFPKCRTHYRGIYGR